MSRDERKRQTVRERDRDRLLEKKGDRDRHKKMRDR